MSRRLAQLAQGVCTYMLLVPLVHRCSPAVMPGGSGIVIGALLPDGSVDVDTVKQLVTAARPCSVTFHRAIDVCNDINAAFEVGHWRWCVIV